MAGEATAAEGLRKSALIWVTPAGGRAQAVWHVVEGDAVYVLTGGAEQPDPGLGAGGEVTVTVRSKDKGMHLVSYPAEVQEVPVEEWEPLLPTLVKARLNLPDAATATERWAAECTLYRLVSTGGTVDPGTGSQAAAPPPTPATSRVPIPFTLGRARGSRR